MDVRLFVFGDALLPTTHTHNPPYYLIFSQGCGTKKDREERGIFFVLVVEYHRIIHCR